MNRNTLITTFEQPLIFVSSNLTNAVPVCVSPDQSLLQLEFEVVTSLTRISRPRQARGKWILPITAKNNLFMKENMPLVARLEVDDKRIRDVFHHLRGSVEHQILGRGGPQVEEAAISCRGGKKLLNSAVHRTC